MRDLCFLVDVDNTLLDNDSLKKELHRALEAELGEAGAIHFWEHYDEFKKEQGLVDFPKIVEEYCSEKDPGSCEVVVGRILRSIDFQGSLYGSALKVLEHLKFLGRVFLFSEGDMGYQKLKLDKSGLTKAADGVFLFEHKLDHLDEVLKNFPDSQVVLIEDKAAHLEKVKLEHPEMVGVEVCQGHYAHEDHDPHENFDMVVDHVSELLEKKREDFGR